MLAAGILTTVLAIGIAFSLLIPPLVPELPLAERAPATRGAIVGTRTERERLAFRRRIVSALVRHPTPPSRHGAKAPVVPTGRVSAPSTSAPAANGAGSSLPLRRTKPIVAGFYVNWEDNSRASLEEHVRDLDWVIGEWAFLGAAGDSTIDAVDRRVFDVVEKVPRAQRPAFFLMVSNFDTTAKRFDPEALRRALTIPANRARVIGRLRDVVARYGLAGVTIDFEDVPPGLADAEVEFAREMRAALAPRGGKLTQAVPVSATTDADYLRRIASVNDYVIPMIFDEHYQGGDPGPIASQAFYEQRARDVVAAIPPGKAVLMVGAYGYNWNDAVPEGSPLAAETMTFQETMAAAREHHAVTHWDTTSLNPYMTWTDPDSVDHVVWYLDGATAHNQVAVGDSLRVAGQAIWRLGDEDGAVWQALRRAPSDSLRRVPPGYDVEFQNAGEMLQIVARPEWGARVLHYDRHSGLVVYDSITRPPVPYVVDRYGSSPHRVALTFDDGPDGRWTPEILDTLKAYHVPATFFVIGQNVETHIGLLRRIFREGHEIGNHTYSHPNLALVSDKRVKLELDANARLIEAVLDHRSAFFRPPYFGDATPTTSDELDPVGIATKRGYVTVGLRDDSEDWQDTVSVREIIRNVIAQRDSGNVVLLHDGGGDRSRTLAALGPMIDSLRARGDTLVLVSELAGISRDQAMPPLAAISEARRLVELAFFSLLGIGEIVGYWLFMAAVVLGIARLVVVGGLAVAQRLLSLRPRPPVPPFTPPVSVIVPAYNEGKVIIGTVASLLQQEYAGDLEVVIVDDGSTDDTLAIARDAFGDERRVTILTKPNGGKASALNFGIARARHEIVVCLDADTMFPPETVHELVQPLADESVGAVAGNAKVGNRVNLVTRWQALEYVTSQNLDRRAFSLVNGITVVPGAVGAWRRSVVQQVGGFRGDTLAEDQDLTLAVRRAGYSIAYAERAIGYTEAPDTLKALAKQRFRWSFGTLQCAWKHASLKLWGRGNVFTRQNVLFRPRHGSLGWIALPNTWLFQLLLPAISPIADLMFLYSLASVYFTYVAHGGTYALTSLEHVLQYYAIFLIVDWLAAVIAFLMEPGEEKSLTWLILLQRFAYRQVMYWVVVRAFKAALSGRLYGWGKLERKATVQVPA